MCFTTWWVLSGWEYLLILASLISEVVAQSLTCNQQRCTKLLTSVLNSLACEWVSNLKPKDLQTLMKSYIAAMSGTRIVLHQVEGTIVAMEGPGSGTGKHTAWLQFKNLLNFSLAGSGKINGKGNRWWNHVCRRTMKVCERTKITSDLSYSVFAGSIPSVIFVGVWWRFGQSAQNLWQSNIVDLAHFIHEVLSYTCRTATNALRSPRM